MGNSLLIGLSISEMLLGVNSETIPTYCMSFKGSQMLGFVHKGSIAYRPRLCKAARSKLHTNVSLLGLRFHDIEPKIELVKQGDKFIDRFFFAFDGDIVSLDLVFQSRLTQNDAIEDGTRNGYTGISLRRMPVSRIT